MAVLFSIDSDIYFNEIRKAIFDKVKETAQ